MGVKLVRYTYSNSGFIDPSDHDELINRDMKNQHPIYAITGLQEVLNILEDNDQETNTLMKTKETAIYEKIANVIKDINEINKQIASINNFNVIKKIEETYSLKLEYDTTAKTLKGNVKIYTAKDDSNAIVETSTGLYVPKTITKDTETIEWSVETKGEPLDEIFNNGLVFSHADSWNNIHVDSEAKAWYWDDSLQSFVQPLNTVSFTGFVTQNFYDNYTHTATMKSTDGDNDLNGLVIGFVFDENGNPHTLSAICDAGGTTARWALIYDYRLPDQQILFTSGNGPEGTIPSYRPSGWSSANNGITINVTKHENLVTCTCSDWGSTELNERTKISIDLNNYSWGYLFRNQVRYGYCNYSQARSYFTDIVFLSKNTASSQTFLASVKISQESGNGITKKDDGLYAPAFVVSPDAGNSLIKRSNGYYVANTTVSTRTDNVLTRLSDGLYVRDQSNIKTVTQEDHGFIIGDFIYYHPQNAYQKASAIDDYDSNIVGMVTKVLNNNSFEYQWSGFFKTSIFSNDNGYIQGMPLYISDIEAGKVTQEQPDISKAVGYPVENIGLIISIERGIQYNMEASIGDFKTSANTYNVRSDGFIRIVENIEYKQSLIQRLLDGLSDEFKATYIVFDNKKQIIKFINIESLYTINQVPEGLYLFIKAF